MTSGTDISVVIPLYNKGPYIVRAVESALRQSNPPQEVIVVDDGSTDGGGDNVKWIKDSRVRLIQQKNAGECAARNRGISEAASPFIAFLDADDEWKPGFLSHICELVDYFPGCGAYATSAQVIRPDGSISYPSLMGLPPEPWKGIIPNFFELFQYGYAFIPSSTMVPKKVLDEVGGFPIGVNLSGDIVCWVNIALRHPIAFNPVRAVIYHQEAQNRVGTIYLPLKEMPYIPILEKAIADGSMPNKYKQAVLEFMALKQIDVATENIMAGNPDYARQLLRKCKYTKKYKRNWFKWRFWASMPAGLPRNLLEIKQAITRYSG